MSYLSHRKTRRHQGDAPSFQEKVKQKRFGILFGLGTVIYYAGIIGFILAIGGAVMIVVQSRQGAFAALSAGLWFGLTSLMGALLTAALGKMIHCLVAIEENTYSSRGKDDSAST